MSDFETKWKACVARAKDAPGRNETAPFGFASRVAAAAAAQRSDVMSLEAVWQRLTLRSLGVVGALLVLCAVLELPQWRDRSPFETQIEDTVGQLVWHL